MVEKCCQIYFCNNQFFVVCWHRTITGLSISGLPMLRIEYPASAVFIGEAVQTVLNASQQGVPVPQNARKELSLPLLRFVGFTSWNKFQEKAEACLITLQNDNELLIKPYRKYGKSFTADVGKEFRCDNAAEDIGKAVLTIFALTY